MDNILCKLAPAVVLSLPLIAWAQAGRDDPADPGLAAPALRYRSAFADYKPWQDNKPGDWRAVNDAVRDAATRGGAHSGHGMPAGARAPAPAPQASAPPLPDHAGHHPHGGKP